MKLLKYISLFLLSFWLVSCLGLKKSWTNFRAHYNTYYNAEKSFKAGLKKVEDQPVEINPELPIRVHRQPPQVSEEDFDNAIEKGAQTLRKFPESKWTDDALFLIGKSYYYKRDYYLAIEKFEELKELSNNPTFKQRAAIWKGRSLLDLEQYGEGVSYITNDLNAEFWSPSLKAEFQVLLAEHLAMLENWNEAADYLGEAVSNVKEGVVKARTFFLYGQVLERLKRYGEAFFAYGNVASRFPDYEYVFWSQLKKAEVARKEGNLEPAVSVFISMSKDDKNFSRLDRINYEIARTLEMQGKIKQAEEGYKEILRSDYSTTSRNVQAKTYYRLGKIYSNNYNKFGAAAAYFDSSSSQITDISFLESDFDAQNLASAYGSYANLKTRINRLDSLLWLGSLQPAQLDSVLEVVRKQKRKSINERLENQEGTENRLVNINSRNQVDEGSTNSSEYGFLNYRNPRLRRESINKFKAVWGNRPLVDNWRRMEVVRTTGISSYTAEDVSEGNKVLPVSNEDDSKLNIDVSEIPTTEEKKNEYLEELVNVKYELGNLFFLTLNMPDSAKTYFSDIVRNYPESPVVPRAMYSLFELHSETGNNKRARYWGNRILQEFDNSRYAKKVSTRLNGGEEEISVADSSDLLLSQVQQIETSADTLSPINAERFRRLAISNRSAKIAPFIHYKAIKAYVELAKSSTNTELYNQFLQAQVKTDTLSQAADSLKTTAYPFYGTYWDSVRTVISEYDTMFTRKPHEQELNALKEVLDTSSAPSEPKVAKVKSGSGSPERPVRLKSCGELNTDIVGGMRNFLARVYYPTELYNKELSGELSYQLMITKKGKVSSYKLASSNTSSAVEEAFGKAIENSLLFDPVTVQGEAREVSCRMTFPVVAPSGLTRGKSLKACKDLSANLEIVGGMKNFLSKVEYPESLQDKKLSGDIIYEILITKKGNVGSYKLVSTKTSPAVEEAFGKAIENNLLFDPVTVNGRPLGISCKITFPLTPPPSKPSPEQSIKACKDIDANIEIVGGMANFLSNVEYSDDLQDMKQSEEIKYEILITKKGKVGSYKLISPKMIPALEHVYGAAIKNNLLLDPVSVEGKRQEVRCAITFPVKN